MPTNDNDQINGTLILLDVDGSNIAMATSATLNIEQDNPDASHKGSGGWSDAIAGQRSYTIDSEALASLQSQGNFDRLTDLVLQRSRVSFKFGTDLTSTVRVTGHVLASSISLDAPNEDTSTLSNSLQGVGPLQKEEVQAT